MHRLPRLIIGLFFLASLSVAVLGLMSRMVADDFCYAATALQGNAFQNVITQYQVWGGSYSEIFLKSIIAPFQVVLIPLATGLFMLLFWVTAKILIEQMSLLFHLPLKKWHFWLLAGVWAFIGINGAPSRQSVFWFSIFFRYSIPITLIFLYCAGILWACRAKRTPLTLWGITLLTSVGIFLSTGMSELYAMGQVIAFGLVLVYGFWCLPHARRETLILIGMPLVVAILCFAVVLLSPGNSGREARVLADYNYVRPPILSVFPPSLAITVVYSFLESYGLANRAMALIAVVFIVAWQLPLPMVARLPLPKRVGWVVLATLILGLMNSGMAVVATLYTTGDIATRVLFPSHVMWVGIWMLWGYFLVVGFARYPLVYRLIERPIFRLTQATLQLLLVVFPLIVIIYNLSIAPNFLTFAQAWDVQDALLRQRVANGQRGVIEVMPFGYYLEDYLVLDTVLRNNRPTWVANCFNAYYGIEGITNPTDS